MSDPTTAQTARLAIGHILEAWPYLDEARQAALRRERPRRGPLTAAQRAELDALVRAERLDRLGQQRRGLVPQPAVAAPARVAIIDAEVHTRQTLVDQVYAVAEQLGTNRWWWLPALDGPVPSLAMWLDLHVDDLDANQGTRLAGTLNQTAQQLLSALRLTEQWTAVAAECPACNRRTLRAYLGSPQTRDHTIRCHGRDPACICNGRSCPCQRPGRRAATAHVWPAAQFRQLALAATLDDDWVTAKQAARALTKHDDVVTEPMVRAWARRYGLREDRRRGEVRWLLADVANAENRARHAGAGRRRRVA